MALSKGARTFWLMTMATAGIVYYVDYTEKATHKVVDSMSGTMRGCMHAYACMPMRTYMDHNSLGDAHAITY